MPSAASAQAHWVIHPRRDEGRACALAAALDAPLPVAHALVNRGIDSADRARRFLEPALENLSDPRQMLGMDQAAARIHAAIAGREKIFILGDYDVDGITSTFLLYSVLRALGAQAEYHIPSRGDGYGPTRETMDRARRSGCGLVVTVDCGITAVEAVAYGRTLGIDTVITDHHEPHDPLPGAVAIVNPRQPGCPYPFKSLAGVGVAFKLAQVLLGEAESVDRARRYLDVVALGTIADVVPLVDENRILAREGLELLNRRERPGLRALMNIARLGEKRVTSSHVAFVLAPRINACARMDDPEQGVRLLLASQEDEAAACAESLEEYNDARRGLDSSVLAEACDMLEKQRVTDLESGRTTDRRSIVLWSKEWKAGVIGIVASRLVERYRVPTLLVSRVTDRGGREQWRGSGRTVPRLSLVQLLDGCHDLLVQHGGHEFAAGLTIREENLPALRDRFEQLVSERYDPAKFTPRHEVDDDLDVAGCTHDIVEWIDRMAPS